MICIIFCTIAFLYRGYGDTTIPSLNYKDYAKDLLAQDVVEVVRETINMLDMESIQEYHVW